MLTKRKSKKVTRIIPGKSKDWHSTDNLIQFQHYIKEEE